MVNIGLVTLGILGSPWGDKDNGLLEVPLGITSIYIYKVFRNGTYKMVSIILPEPSGFVGVNSGITGKGWITAEF